MRRLPKYYANIRFYVNGREKHGYLEPPFDIDSEPKFCSEKDNLFYPIDSIDYWEYMKNNL